MHINKALLRSQRASLVGLVLWTGGCANAPHHQRRALPPIIDTHIHLYDTSRAEGVPWPAPTDTVLYRPVLPGDFNAVANANGVTAAVIVEASEWIPDNQWVLDLVRDQPGRFPALVGNLPVGTPEFEPNLKRLSADPRFVGIRLRQRPGGATFFNEEVWRDLKLLAAMGKTLDVLMEEFSLADVDTMARRVPNLRILMDHVAGAAIDGRPPDPQWIQGLENAARNPNVHCKVSGLFDQSHRQPSPPDPAFYRPVLDELWRVFGEDRLIYGSNWPVTKLGGDYATQLSIVVGYFEPKGRRVVGKLLSGNALKFYGVRLLKRE